MLAGWPGAPLHPAALLLAQFLGGLCQAAFEGDMDSRVAEDAPSGGVTTALAYSAATRALGGAVAVRALPMLVTAQSVNAVASGSVLVLGTAALAIWTVTVVWRRDVRRALPN